MNETETASPEAHKVIFADRNATWADWIDRRMDKPGIVFLGVGTGHLAGRDSVQEFLDKRGIKSSARHELKVMPDTSGVASGEATLVVDPKREKFTESGFFVDIR